MTLIKIDKRKQIILNRVNITALKNAVKDECKFNRLSKERVLEMIHFYIGK